MKKKLIAGVAGVALVAGVGLSMPQIAQAETLTTTASASVAPGKIAAPTDRLDGRGPGGNGIAAAALATKLGLPEATVSDALSAVRDKTEPATRPSANTTKTERDAARDSRHTAFAKALAAELNIDEATVTTAMAELQTERETARTANKKATLDQAVTDGILTQAEADAVKKANEAGIVFIRGGRHGRA